MIETIGLKTIPSETNENRSRERRKRDRPATRGTSSTAMASRPAQGQRQKIRGSGMKTPEMHASFECEKFEDHTQFEDCVHKEAENWALSKGCGDALRAPGSSRPRHAPKKSTRDPSPASDGRTPLDDCAMKSNQNALPLQTYRIEDGYRGGPIPPEIKKIRDEGLRKYSPLDYQMFTKPYSVNTPFLAWGRKWVIKRSEHYPQGGLALFAGELIFVKVTPDNRHTVPLFPYIGPMYRKSDYEEFSSFYPHLRKYALDPKSCVKKRGDKTKDEPEMLYNNNYIIVGTPKEDCNLAGYIQRMDNANCRWEANCRFEEINRPPKTKVDEPWVPYSRDHDRKAYPYLDKLNSCQNSKYMHKYVMVVARRPIQAGEELFVDQPFYN